jgi:hypothetical protein
MFSCTSFMVAAVLLAAELVFGSESVKRQVTFDEQKVGEPPASFTCAVTGNGRAGAWKIVEDASAPTRPNAVALLEVEDSTFAGSGKVGLWTKADSVMYFDDLRVEVR